MRYWLVPALAFIFSACIAAPNPKYAAQVYPVAPTVGANTPAPIQYSDNGFTVVIYSPADGDVVNSPQLELTGWTNADTVMTVNEGTYVLTGHKLFTIPVTLSDGPNAIEIVASDYAGNEISVVLTVTYQSE